MHTRHTATGLCLFASLLLAGPAPAQSQGSVTVTAPAGDSGNARSAAKTRKIRTPRVPAPPEHGETRSERDQRLRRECKGRPNAGACEGYAS